MSGCCLQSVTEPGSRVLAGSCAECSGMRALRQPGQDSVPGASRPAVPMGGISDRPADRVPCAWDASGADECGE